MRRLDRAGRGDVTALAVTTAPPHAAHSPGLVMALVVLAFLGALPGCATAQVSAKLDANLAALHAAYVACRQQQTSCPPNEVVIDAVASGDAGALRIDLTALGMRQIAVAGRIVSGWLPVPAIPCLAGLATLQFARQALSGTRPGAADTHLSHALADPWPKTGGER
jgi:hypothetical protein